MLGMLAIPYLSHAGVVNIKFRRLTDDTPKYMGLSGVPVRMYNVRSLHDTNEIAICEGELDALTLDGVVGIPAVGVAGTQNWKPHYRLLFEAFRTVWVFYDRDKKEDGSNPGWALARAIQKDVPHATLVTLPENVDVNKLFVTQGRQAVLDLIGW
jgi:DNA primase